MNGRREGGPGSLASFEGEAEPVQSSVLGSQMRTVTMGRPLTERPSSSPRPDIGKVYVDRVLLVWKPMESFGPVTYIVQCCKEGTGWYLCPCSPPQGVSLSLGPPPRSARRGLGETWPVLWPWAALGKSSPPFPNCFSLTSLWPGDSWTTLASDISDCCYLTSKLSRGGVYAFRTACVSKAGMGPYSSPSEQVLLGGPSHLGEPLLGAQGSQWVKYRHPFAHGPWG
jgi:hypothetical protein